MTTCGVGKCAEEGTIVRSEESWSIAANPRIPVRMMLLATADDDDGLIDEDYLPEPLSCGLGACAASGETVCVDGKVESDCTPLDLASDDGNCDGVDNDCDGSVDEHFQTEETARGVGACAGKGVLVHGWRRCRYLRPDGEGRSARFHL